MPHSIREIQVVKLSKSDIEKLSNGEKLLKVVCRVEETNGTYIETCAEIRTDEAASKDALPSPRFQR